MTRTGDRIHIEISVDQFNLLLLALGIASGYGYSSDQKEFNHEILRLADAINLGNPEYEPYNV